MGSQQSTLQEKKANVKPIVIKGLALDKVHAYICQHQDEVPCELSTCKDMQLVQNHWETCEVGESCDFVLCSFSGRMLNHPKNCVEPECHFCVYFGLRIPSFESPSSKPKSSPKVNSNYRLIMTKISENVFNF